MSDLKPVIDRLRGKACDTAVVWLETQPDVETAWASCSRGDWMMWILEQVVDTKKLAACDIEIRRTVLKFVPDGEDRPRITIDTYERWAKGEASDEELTIARAAGADAWAAGAARAATWDAAWYAARAAARAAQAARAAGDAARSAALSDFSDIVRKHFPQAPKLEAHNYDYD